MDETLKLFKVNLAGFCNGPYGSCMVVSVDPTSAYETVRAYLDENGLGFDKDRVLKSIELVAECADYPDASSRLFLDCHD